MQPERVPEVLKTSINFKVLGLIFAGIIGLQAFLYLVPHSTEVEDAMAYFSMAAPLVVAIASFYVAHRYGLSQVFGKSYLMFSIAYFAFFLAEVTYYAYDVIYGIDPYPSFADVFFFALYPFTAFHILINLKFFKTKTKFAQKIPFIIVPVIFFSAYTFTASDVYGGIEGIFADEVDTFDYFYGLIFVAAAAVPLALAAYVAIIFRGGMLGVVWILLMVGILINNIGDVWYYYLELFEGYDLYHPVNLFWYSSHLVLIYALYKHSRSI